MAKIIPQETILKKYFITSTLPTPWCPGCGGGSIGHAMLQAIERMQLDPKKITLVSGIGCNGHFTRHLKFDDLHVLHGRAPAVATGLKMARPDLHVIVIQGDGDAASIGGNHLIHAARRNIGIKILLSNNYTYGRTGGQRSPTTPRNSLTATSPFGMEEPAFDLCKLVAGAGATFVARGTAYHAVQLIDIVERAIAHPGFAFVEVMAPCPTQYGRKNPGSGVTPSEMLKWLKENSISVDKLSGKSEKSLEGKIITGIFVEKSLPEYSEAYNITRQKAQRGSKHA
jgi:2-oxoglutarate ferredoxin oxidoreductase subunit beta